MEEKIIPILKVVIYFLGLLFLTIIAFTSLDIFREWREVVIVILAVVGLLALVKWGKEWIESE